MYELQAAVAKVSRSNGLESGDTLEMIERPNGGFSFVLVAGQGSGRGAKTLSNLVATRALSMLKDGARDGAVARAAHDYLYTYRMGQTAATLNIISVDFVSHTLVLSRNNPAPFYVITPAGLSPYAEASSPIGLHPLTKPVITELSIQPFMYLVVFTGGLLKAGERFGTDMELENYLGAWDARAARPALDLTEALLARAMELEHGEPAEDISILSVAVLPSGLVHSVRRMQVSVPFHP